MVLKVTTTGLQKAKFDVRQALKKMVTEATVTIGIHESAGEHEGGISNAALGATLHYGTEDGRIPARPWLDVGVATGNKEYLQLIADGFEDGLDHDLILEQVGLVAVGKVQAYMVELKEPPNAPSTIEKKGDDNPLIDDGVLRQSVTSVVQSNRPPEGLD